ncbi:ATP-grasp domain-containing protein [Aerococcus urinaeequi]|uniref:ATP-grasp domain-containing protein n=1 Tax=Aerococcus urinaeequi TaxID=51665 RepID=UPI003D6A2B04
MNILILSAGTRNKVVQYFKKELRGTGKVITTDANKLAPALYEADEYYVVPRIDHPNYLEILLDICQKEAVDGVISLIDPELSLLSENREKFMEIGVTPIISDHDLIELSFNKYEFSKFVENLGFDTIKTYRTFDEFNSDFKRGVINFPVFVKPINGSASLNTNTINNMAQLKTMLENNKELIIQEFMEGEEFGVDVYIDLLSKMPVSIFVKEKILMRAGETDKSVSIIDEDLTALIKDFVIKANYRGIVDIDIFKKDNKYIISEVNPRFGGGYPHAYESGINVPSQIINNLNGVENEENSQYDPGIYMMKYNDIFITRENG